MMTLQRRKWAARMFRGLARLSNRLAALPNALTPPAFRLMQIGSAFWQSRVLWLAAQWDIATMIGDGDADAAELATRVAADPRAFYRLMRMLCALGVFDETAPGRFRNNRLSNGLRADRQGNVRAMVLMHNSMPMSRPWFEQLEQGVRTGKPPFRLAHGIDLYPYMDAHPEFDALFSQAMESVEALAGDSFVTGFDWGRFERVIDLGGSRGAKAMAILRRHPRMQALVVDRANTVEAAAAAAAATRADPGADRAVADLLSRIRFVAGDLLGQLPVATSCKDVYLLCAVLHGMSDDDCVAVLRNVASAAASRRATILLMEMVLPDRHVDLASASFDLQMLMGTEGCERTAGEWRQLFVSAGVDLVETVELASFGKLQVLYPSDSGTGPARTAV